MGRNLRLNSAIGEGRDFSSLLVCFAVLVLAAGRLLGASLTASIDRDTITLGETATLSLSFEGGQPRGLPTIPDIPNLTIAYGGQSSQVTLVNGQMSSTITYTFQVAAQQAGNYTIPTLTAEVGGQRVSTQPIQLKVVRPGAPPPEAIRSGNQPAFAKVLVPRKEVFVGETFVAQLQIYLQSRLQGAYGIQLTGFGADGFTTGKMDEGQHRQAQIGNSVYTIIPLSVVLHVNRPGPLTVGPATFNLTPRRDPFEGFFGNRNTAPPLTLASEAETVQSLPLPRENVPADFTGAIGSYTMNVAAGPTDVKTGDPITVKIALSGRGWLDALTLPERNAWKDFKTYPPTSKVEFSDKLGIQGTKTFEQIITPENADIKSLPPVTFSFFDPDKKSYQTLMHPASPLTVRASGATPTPVILAGPRQEAAPPTQDIVPNKQRPGALAQIGPPLAAQPWFLALQSAPVLAFLGALAWRKRVDALANNPRLRRQRQVAQVLKAGLLELQRLAAANQSDDFFATVFRLLQERLGERLNLPATAITEAVIDERLRPQGVPATVLDPLQELFQTCNFARYAPSKSSQELAALIPRVEKVLQDLQGMKL